MTLRNNKIHTRGPSKGLRAAAFGAFSLLVATEFAIAQGALESAIVRGATASAVAGSARPATKGGANPPLAVVTAGEDAGKAVERPRVNPGPSCPAGLPEPTRVQISVGRSTLINLPEPIVRRTLGDPQVVDTQMVSPRVLYLVSGRVGHTNAILQGESGRCIVLDISVAVDTDSIRGKLGELLPAEKGIVVSSAADSVVLSGTVSDAIAVDRAVAIANAFVRSAYQQGGTVAAGAQGAGGISPRIVNMLSLGSPQQVMLEVKVAEVSKNLLDKLGVRLAGTRTNGTWTYQLISDFLLGGAGATAGANRNIGNGLSIEADKRDGLVRILAEPTVMAVSGQEGSFLAGGRIFIPVAQSSSTGGVTITLQEKEFGVGLKFTPTVLADGRINLRVLPEVSELSREGVGISTSSTGGNAILPLITTRRASTTVQLFDGQSFAIGGLIRSSSSASINAFPVLGELPVIGPLFRSTDFQSDRTELVFVVTPRLVKPLPPNYQLPTDRVGDPTRRGVIVDGQLDSTPSAGAPASGPAGRSGGMELK